LFAALKSIAKKYDRLNYMNATSRRKKRQAAADQLTENNYDVHKMLTLLPISTI